MKSLKGKIAVVTGAGRGIGKGAALGLAMAGATIYAVGRTKNDEGLPEFLRNTGIYNTVDEINALGGIGISHICDLAKEEEHEKLFQRIKNEQGRLDILVNSAWAGGAHVMGGYFFNTPFYKQPVSILDDCFIVGVRSNYIASKYAAKIMINQNSGLIVNISYYGARRYFNNVSYGVCKAAVDKLSADTAYELKENNIKVFSLYPGTVATEGMIEAAKYDKTIDVGAMETPAFVGKCIEAIASDDSLLNESGKVLITAEIAQKYGFTDINGRQPASQRDMLW
ncbi:MAG: SDR family NAD(P)-dependent oxidoreductase [Eubacteriaceae bacterium]|nr:SDR family NAD(P)-dependent oxidoreductase [Eubacteriaceae bacterium]